MKTWVVYLMTVQGNQDSGNAVCERREWDAMERGHPGFHTLVQDGFTSEAEAERMARGTSGDPRSRGQVPVTTLHPLLVAQG